MWQAIAEFLPEIILLFHNIRERISPRIFGISFLLLAVLIINVSEYNFAVISGLCVVAMFLFALPIYHQQKAQFASYITDMYIDEVLSPTQTSHVIQMSEYTFSTEPVVHNVTDTTQLIMLRTEVDSLIVINNTKISSMSISFVDRLFKQYIFQRYVIDANQDRWFVGAQLKGTLTAKLVLTIVKSDHITA